MYEAGEYWTCRESEQNCVAVQDSPELREEGRLSVSFIEFNPKVEVF